LLTDREREPERVCIRGCWAGRHLPPQPGSGQRLRVGPGAGSCEFSRGGPGQSGHEDIRPEIRAGVKYLRGPLDQSREFLLPMARIPSSSVAIRAQSERRAMRSWLDRWPGVSGTFGEYGGSALSHPRVWIGSLHPDLGGLSWSKDWDQLISSDNQRYCNLSAHHNKGRIWPAKLPIVW